MERDYNNDHMEDYDSKVGDVEKGSLAATQSSESTRQLSLHEEGVRRGVMNANTELNNQSAKTPDGFLNMLENGGYSVTTGKMDDMVDEPLDTYTFDGSTITSAMDITHKKFSQPQRQVVEFPGNGQAQYQGPPIKPSATESTTESSWGGKVSEKASAFCCGLGRLTVILLSIAVTVFAAAFILWLVLGYLPSQGDSSSACCKGSFEPEFSGREICNANDVCCVVCASSIVQEDANPQLTGIEVEEEPQENENPEPVPEAEPQQDEDPEPKPEVENTDPPTPRPTDAAPTSPSPTVGEPSPSPTAGEPSPSPTAGEPSPSPTAGKAEESPAPSVVAPEATLSPVREAETPGTSPPTSGPSSAEEGETDTPAPTSEVVVVTGETETAEPLPCCEDLRWGDYDGRKRCHNSNEGEKCCTVCMAMHVSDLRDP